MTNLTKTITAFLLAVVLVLEEGALTKKVVKPNVAIAQIELIA